jgi:glycosyltransferase involved in cell wall biosynthesis
MAFFSTIIPVYNRAELAAAAVESVLAQEDGDQEIIVVDDGSTDGTAAALARFGDRIRILRQENRGPGAARNLGIKHAAGQYVTFLDSDDLWFPWTLRMYREAIERYQQPAFVAGRAVEMSHDQWARQQPVAAPSPANADLVAKLYRDYLSASQEVDWIGTCAVAIRTDWLQRVGGFPDDHVNAEDSDLWLRLGEAPGFVSLVTPPVFVYRRHVSSAAQNLDRSYAGTSWLVRAEQDNLYPGGQQRRRERWEVLTRHIRPLSMACVRQGHSHWGWQLYRSSFLWNLRLRRMKYLVGFPLYSMRCLTKRTDH